MYDIQIQHLLKLNKMLNPQVIAQMNSNTTLVKVKFGVWVYKGICFYKFKYNTC